MNFKKAIAGFVSAALMLTYTFLPEYNLMFKANAETDEAVYSEELRSGNFGYKKVDENNDGKYDYVTITDFYDGSADEIIIPNKIDGLDTKGVDNFAFWRIENKLSVIISESLDSKCLGKYAFITAAVTYQNAVVPAGTDSLEGVLEYYLNDYGINYTDDKVTSYVDYAATLVKASERDFDINSLSVSQFITILFDEIASGKSSLSEENMADFRFFLNTFSHKNVELLSYYSLSNIKNGYARSKVALKYKLLTAVSIPNAGISLSKVEIDPKNNEAIVDIDLNTASKGFDIYIYSDSPVKIHELTNAYSTEHTAEYGESCIHGTFISPNGESLKNTVSSVKISIPDNTEPGVYPVYIAINYLKNENGIFIKNPSAVNGSVTVKEKSVPTDATEPTVSTVTTTIGSAATDSQSTTVTTVTTSATSDSIENNKFIWGKDNWKFNNSNEVFSDNDMKNDYSDTLRNNSTNIEWTDMHNYSGKEQKNYSYGMSALEVLSKNGLIPYSNYTLGSNDLFSLEVPSKNNDVNSLINYYTYLQFKNNIQQLELKTMLNSHESNIKNIISQLESSPQVLVGYQKAGWGKQTAVAYDVTYGEWKKNGVKYNGRIEIYDPDSSEKYDEDRCIYFDRSTYNWEIPLYKVNSPDGAVITLISGDINAINNGGYLKGTTPESSDEYYSTFKIYSADKSYEINKINGTDNNLSVNESSDNDDILPVDFYNPAGEPEFIKGYILKDTESAYKFSQTNQEKSKTGIRFKNSSYNADISVCSEIIFDPSGYVGFKGNNSKYSLNMIFNENYPTDWYQINISGAGADNISLKKSEKGYFMYGNNFKDVVIKMNNYDTCPTFKFSTEYKQVYIYEINKTTIGVSVDTDNDGIYETKLEDKSNEPENNYIIGDISNNGAIDIYDAIIIAESLVGKRKFTDDELAIADINCDGKVDLYDAIEVATRILKNNQKK